ncbi:MAG: hypothetical protein O3C62_11270 [Actinomycetota bacterium]|nr:hypothetical protein [Actinomycetota bacterium]MDA2972269.1 hypothetical protein [Actinomycetota bacterium]MDA3002243.1 hypothetical protein [Actinomycetota bacterium]
MTTPRTRRLFETDPNSFTIGPWIDPTLEQYGYPVTGQYVETFWLSTLGPTSTWLLRRLVNVLEVAGLTTDVDAEIRVDVDEIAGALGVGSASDRLTPLAKALDRLVMFGTAQVRGERLVVRRFLAPLAAKQIGRLPAHLHRSHSSWATGEETIELPVIAGLSRARSAA